MVFKCMTLLFCVCVWVTRGVDCFQTSRGKRAPENAWVYEGQTYSADGSPLSYPQQSNNKNTFEIIVLESPSGNESPANKNSPAKLQAPISIPASDAVQLLSLLYDGKQSENGLQENIPQENLYTTQSTVDPKNAQPHDVVQVYKSNPPQHENEGPPDKEIENLPQHINPLPRLYNWEPPTHPSPPRPHHPPPPPPPPPHHWYPPPPPPPDDGWGHDRREPPPPPPPPENGWGRERRDPPPHARGPPGGRGPPPHARGRGPPPHARGPPHRDWETASDEDRKCFDEPNMQKESPAQMEKSVNKIDRKDPVSNDSNAFYDRNQGRGVPLTVNKGGTHDDIQQSRPQPQPHIFQVVPVTPES